MTDLLETEHQEAALRVCDLCKTFGRGDNATNVLKGLSFEVPRGHVVSLLGANGAGKTTLVNIASTLMLPTSGEICVCGTDVVANPSEVRRRTLCSSLACTE